VTVVKEEDGREQTRRAVYAPPNIPWSADDIRAGRAALPMLAA
jgi:hypothetical protein